MVHINQGSNRVNVLVFDLTRLYVDRTTDLQHSEKHFTTRPLRQCHIFYSIQYLKQLGIHDMQ